MCGLAWRGRVIVKRHFGQFVALPVDGNSLAGASSDVDLGGQIGCLSVLWMWLIVSVFVTDFPILVFIAFLLFLGCGSGTGR